jgi:Domain of unknown function (DUF5655)/Domain of unknown function (DUF4287)
VRTTRQHPKRKSTNVDEASAKALDNLAEKTGRPVSEWLEIARGYISLGHRAGLERLKTQHGIGHGYANLLMLTVRAEADAAAGTAPTDPVEAQYSGPKAALRPIYDALVEQAIKLGADVEVAPKKATVSLRRAKQFALLTPATRDRIDLGLNLPGTPATGRLATTTGMCTHKVGLHSLPEVDDEVLGWLRAAYQQARKAP